MNTKRHGCTTLHLDSGRIHVGCLIAASSRTEGANANAACQTLKAPQLQLHMRIYSHLLRPRLALQTSMYNTFVRKTLKSHRPSPSTSITKGCSKSANMGRDAAEIESRRGVFLTVILATAHNIVPRSWDPQ
eukprot:gnl/MRDRNA2_/MRDRNA2_81434_c0_seq1.p1 gnl/MRDRNA2_/MRDRNA2_81434_c0~~gnl/MRDRNA2_/MRDRNA2_81434_c0_seq1.p1  ORF type:complete len:132 (-),score=9.24 gnl/MRDRNA2_/MRDRNA2_81434_c0_seq1:370-765(-)